jgi:drug/metabolite transporter (DMT)-like permease
MPEAVMLSERPNQKPMFGILLMLLSVGSYSLQDAIAKYLAPDFSVIQILFFRALGSVIVLLPLLRQVPSGGWLTRRPGLMLFRCVAGATGMGCYIVAYRTMPLADVSAVGFSGILLVTALSMLLLKEAVDATRWAAIVVGFIGVLIILRPGFEVITVGAVWSMAGAIGFCAMTLSIRTLTRTDHPVMITTYFIAFSFVVLGLMLPALWTRPDLKALGLLLLQGVFCGIGQVLMSTSLKYAPASTVSPFTYTIILYSLAFGFIWFGDIPSPWMLVGTAVLIASCLFLAHREQRAKT